MFFTNQIRSVTSAQSIVISSQYYILYYIFYYWKKKNVFCVFNKFSVCLMFNFFLIDTIEALDKSNPVVNLLTRRSSYGTLPLEKEDEEEKKGNQLGWITGVFVPTMLGIFGVVTFLRMGWVVGQVRLILRTCRVVFVHKLIKKTVRIDIIIHNCYTWKLLHNFNLVKSFCHCNKWKNERRGSIL